MRKKHLKAALADERALNDSLIAEKAAITTEYYKVKRQRDSLLLETEQLQSANASLAGRATAYAASNADLRRQLDTAKRAFGEAFVKGEPEPPRGPSRPNRRKLTEADAKDIRNAYYGGAKQKDLARNYGVNPATISRLVRGIYH
ncbi:helix-turn-helix DNA binding domain protein [Mycobacterium phage NothingSpecial]|nr:helix-turn-helix DNA binding domain protein [Mycobacterium phage NothingSpecial]